MAGDNYRHLRTLGEMLHKDSHQHAGVVALTVYRAFHSGQAIDCIALSLLILSTAEAYVRMIEQTHEVYLT